VSDALPLSATTSLKGLSAQLKVNLRPLWSPATAAISSLSQRFGDLVWELLFAELQALSDPAQVQQEEEGRNHPGKGGAEDEDEDSVNEDERSWRDPSAHKLRVAVGHWLDEGYPTRQFVKVCFYFRGRCNH